MGFYNEHTKLGHKIGEIKRTIDEINKLFSSECGTFTILEEILEELREIHKLLRSLFSSEENLIYRKVIDKKIEEDEKKADDIVFIPEIDFSKGKGRIETEVKEVEISHDEET